jgi:hypothetical protein
MNVPAQAPGPARDPTDRRLATALLESSLYELSHDLGVVEHDALSACWYRSRIDLRGLSAHRADALFRAADGDRLGSRR